MRTTIPSSPSTMAMLLAAGLLAVAVLLDALGALTFISNGQPPTPAPTSLTTSGSVPSPPTFGAPGESLSRVK